MFLVAGELAKNTLSSGQWGETPRRRSLRSGGTVAWPLTLEEAPKRKGMPNKVKEKTLLS